MKTSEWQDIESAPKDGDDILVWGQWLGMLVVSWDDSGNGDGGWLTLDGPRYLSYAFSHWQPLPAPPTGT